jgi:hypothetical protein
MGRIVQADNLREPQHSALATSAWSIFTSKMHEEAFIMAAASPGQHGRR